MVGPRNIYSHQAPERISSAQDARNYLPYYPSTLCLYLYLQSTLIYVQVVYREHLQLCISQVSQAQSKAESTTSPPKTLLLLSAILLSNKRFPCHRAEPAISVRISGYFYWMRVFRNSDLGTRYTYNYLILLWTVSLGYSSSSRIIGLEKMKYFMALDSILTKVQPVCLWTLWGLPQLLILKQ